MNYFEALQRIQDGKWVYTCNRIPVGYCHYNRDDERFHTTGHDTKEEAQECYKKYELDNNMKFIPEELQSPGTYSLCTVEGCTKLTNGSVFVGGYRHFTLCNEHQNRAEVEKIYSVGESWSS